ncbi:MAG: CHAT domain-containing protein [Anaerolineae bacterium]|nr:CHAT domain-containing protein [Anaerolineae bacterium]
MAKLIADSFTIHITGTPDACTIEAHGPGKAVAPPHRFEWNATPEQSDILRALHESHSTVSHDNLIVLGQALYRSMFTPDVAAAFDEARRNLKSDTGIRLRLNIEPAALAALPWELMHDGREFLTVRSSFPLVRTMGSEQIMPRMTIRGPLRILYIGASPQTLPPLNLEGPALDLQDMLGRENARRIQFDIMMDATLENLRTELLKDYHVLCFAGHGDESCIYLDDGYGGAQEISARGLARELDGKSTRMLFLASCETGAAVEEGGQLEGFARQVARLAELPAVAAMQYAVSDYRANRLTARFFEVLAAFRPVDVALAEARKVTISQDQTNRDVFSPVLYLQSETSNIFQKARNWVAIGFALAFILASIIGIGALVQARGQSAQRIEAEATAQMESTQRAYAEATAAVEAEQRTEAEATAAAEAEERARQEAISRSIELASTAAEFIDEGRDLSLLLSVLAAQTADTIPARSSLLAAINYDPHLAHHLHDARAIGFTPDGQQIAGIACGETCDDSATIFWDTASGQRTDRRFAIESDSETTAAYHPDSGRLVSGRGSTLYLWDVASGEPIDTLPLDSIMEGNQQIRKIAFSPDGSLAAAGISGSFEAYVMIWNTETGGVIGPIALSSPNLTGLAIDPGNRYLAAAISNTESQIIDLESGAAHPPVGLPDTSVMAAAFSPDGTTLALAASNGLVYLVDPVSGGLIANPLDGETSGAFSLDFSADGRMLAVGYYNDSAIVWELGTYQKLDQFFAGTPDGPTMPNRITTVRFSTDGKQLITGSPSMVWNLEEPHPLGRETYSHTSWVTDLAFNRDGSRLASVDPGGTLIELDVLSNTQQSRQLSEGAYAVTYTDGGQLLVATDEDSTLKVWDAAADQPIAVLLPAQVRDRPWRSIVFSPDGSQLAAVGFGPFVTLRDIESANVIADIDLTGESGRNLAFSNDGSILAVSADNGPIQLIDTSTGQPGLALDYGQSGTYWQSLAFTPDDLRLVSGGLSFTITQWDVSTGSHFDTELIGHSGSINDLAFDSTGGILFSAAEEQFMLWNINTGELIGSFQTEDKIVSPFYRIAISPDDQLAATGSSDGTVILWDLQPQRWIEAACRMANRELTLEEWENYMGDEPYREICAN